jgi:hypothetical protein
MNCFEDSDDIVLGLLVLSAIRANDTVWFERLMELPRIMAAINASSHPHMLHECARRNRVAFAEFFLKQGVDVDDEDEVRRAVRYCTCISYPLISRVLVQLAMDRTATRPIWSR